MAGGSNKKKFNKPKTRKFAKPSLFVEGGLLSDWSPIITSPPSKGKHINSNSTVSGNKLNSSKNKSAVRFEMGSSSGGKSKASSYVSRKVEPQKPKMNAFAYKYPQASPLTDEGSDRHKKLDESNPIVLVDSKESKIIAYIDQSPASDFETVKYNYDYGASFEVGDSSHRGLGFHDEAEENPSVIKASPVTEKQESSCFDSPSSQEMETDMIDDGASDVEASSSPVANTGFLSIGGMKLYTCDISYDEEEDDDENKDDDEESVDSSESEDSSNSSDSDSAYDSHSDIDDEIAKDYFEGIGGSYEVANVDQLVGQVPDSSDEENDDDDTRGGHINKMLKDLGGIALQDASRQYGMQKPRSRKKSRAKTSKFGAATDDWSAIDDLMLVKNSRSLYGKKKHAAKLPQSWPSKAEKSKSFQRFSGEKKKLHKDMIAHKRRERMIRRGVDLEKINSKLEQMVLNKGDIMSFQPMHSRDCSQVQKLAAIYRLRSGSQGSGKKRFVTVTRTQHTSMPLSSDKVRLEKLLGIDEEEAYITTVGETASNRTNKASRGSNALSPLDLKSSKSKGSGESSKKKRRGRDKTGSYAAQPVSFISSGNMVSEPVETIVSGDESRPTDQTSSDNKPVVSSSIYGAFEMHTTGFGSRMMAKMGYVDGAGLGKNGKGIAEPIEVVQRPKSLGLGAKMPEASNTMDHMNVTSPQKPNTLASRSSRRSESRGKSGNSEFGSFEKHTKGFGSKMMAKMGFVEGMGLGRESQGMVQPLVASRLPKSRGLGAKG